MVLSARREVGRRGRSRAPPRRRRSQAAERDHGGGRARWSPARRAPSRSSRRSTTRCCRPICRRRAAHDLRDAAGAGAARPTSSSTTGRFDVDAAAEERAARPCCSVAWSLAGRLRELPAVHLRARDAPAFVIIDDVTLAQSEPDKPLDADARAVDLLPPESQWQLSAAGSSCSAALRRRRWRVVHRTASWPRHVRARRPPASNRTATARPRGAAGSAAAAATARRTSTSRRSSASGRSRARRNGICSGSSRRPPPPPPPPPAPSRRSRSTPPCRRSAAAAAAAADHAEVHRHRRSADARSEDRGAERRPERAVLRQGRRYHRGPLSHSEDRRGIGRAGVPRRPRAADDSAARDHETLQIADCRLQIAGDALAAGVCWRWRWSRRLRGGQGVPPGRRGDAAPAISTRRSPRTARPCRPRPTTRTTRSRCSARCRPRRARTSSRRSEFEQQDQLEAALGEYRLASEYDPSNRLASRRRSPSSIRPSASASRPRGRSRPIEQLRERARAASRRADPQSGVARAAEPPLQQRQPARHPRTSSRSATGINVTLRPRSARIAPTTVQLDGVTLEQALNQIMTMNQLSYKVLSEQSIFVFPDTPPKHAQYDEQVIRTFYLSHADADRDVADPQHDHPPARHRRAAGDRRQQDGEHDHRARHDARSCRSSRRSSSRTTSRAPRSSSTSRSSRSIGSARRATA